MGRTFASILFATAAAFAVVSPARSETLAQAIADAYRNNPRLQSQRAQLRSIDETVIQAASPYRLTLGIEAAADYTRRRVATNNGFATIADDRGDIVLTASQILSNGGRTAAQVSAAEADVLSAREQLREVENFILLEVIDAYVSVRRDQDLVDIRQKSFDSFLRQVEQATARERGGDLTKTDIAQAEAQASISRAALHQAEANLEQSRARFAAVVGRNPTGLELEPPLPGIPSSAEEAYRTAEASSPILWQAILTERGARARIAAARAERNPIVSVNGSAGYSGPATLETSRYGRALTGTVSLTMPLIAGGVVGSRIRQATAQADQAHFDIESARRAVDQQVLNSWNQAISARAQLVSGEEAVRAARVALVGTQRGFAEGFRSNFEVLNEEQRLLDAQVIVANARYNQYAGQATLLAYLGRLEAAALEQGVPQYDAAANLKRQRARQFGPFQMVLQPLDKALKPSSSTREPQPLPAAADPAINAPTNPPPSGPLARTLPVETSANTPTPPQPGKPSDLSLAVEPTIFQ